MSRAPGASRAPPAAYNASNAQNVQNSHFLDPRRQSAFGTTRNTAGLPRRPPLQVRAAEMPEWTELNETSPTNRPRTPKTAPTRSRLPTPAQVAPAARRPTPVRLVQETDADGVPVFKAAVESRPASTLDGVRVERVRLM